MRRPGCVRGLFFDGRIFGEDDFRTGAIVEYQVAVFVQGQHQTVIGLDEIGERIIRYYLSGVRFLGKELAEIGA